MMARILRIELRRSPAAFIALLSIVLGTGLLLSYTVGFEGRWMQLAVAVRMNLLLMLPLALAGGAWLGRRDTLYRVDELFASTVRPRRQRVVPAAAALALAMVSAYLLVFLIGVPWVAPTSGYFPVAAIAVTVVGAISLIAAGWLGMAAGRAVPRLFTAPALAVVGAAVAGIIPLWMGEPMVGGDAKPGPAALLLSPIHDGNIDDFQTIVARVNTTQALWLTALAITALLLVGAASRRTVALAVLPAVVGAVIAVPLLPAGGYSAAAAVDPVARELVCDSDGPRVCVTRVHAYLLPEVVGPARQALTMLAAKLPDAPTRVVESPQLHDWARSSTDPAPVPHQPDTLGFGLASIGIVSSEFADPIFLTFLLGSAWEQDCDAKMSGEPGGTEGRYLFQEVAAAWLRGQPSTWQALMPEERGQAEDAYRTLTGLPPAEQGRRMAQARAAALNCQGEDLMPFLYGETP
ncbi:DUF3106 domain-containing protein [Micromonospora sp. NBC_01699]|uniref:hypothetical protein n=1 Tax=Micromonospora sp. NBC_01699 TaxID=2975984 RepID=UPI002E2A0489|nr:hypothetical protein [Micromonospora sp. NBC_01699]